jgi:hypothetical protein
MDSYIVSINKSDINKQEFIIEGYTGAPVLIFAIINKKINYNTDQLSLQLPHNPVLDSFEYPCILHMDYLSGY